MTSCEIIYLAYLNGLKSKIQIIFERNSFVFIDLMPPTAYLNKQHEKKTTNRGLGGHKFFQDDSHYSRHRNMSTYWGAQNKIKRKHRSIKINNFGFRSKPLTAFYGLHEGTANPFSKLPDKAQDLILNFAWRSKTIPERKALGTQEVSDYKRILTVYPYESILKSLEKRLGKNIIKRIKEFFPEIGYNNIMDMNTQDFLHAFKNPPKVLIYTPRRIEEPRHLSMKKAVENIKETHKVNKTRDTCLDSMILRYFCDKFHSRFYGISTACRLYSNRYVYHLNEFKDLEPRISNLDFIYNIKSSIKFRTAELVDISNSFKAISNKSITVDSVKYKVQEVGTYIPDNNICNFKEVKIESFNKTEEEASFIFCRP